MGLVAPDVLKAPQDSIAITFALFRRVEHPRIKDAVMPYPGRRTHHTIIENEAQIDETLIAWLREAYEYGRRAKPRIG